jgi:hypothetical protein
VNWLGLSVRSLLGIVLGAVVGSLLYVFSYPSVLVVGACTGAGCALLAEDRSLLRGISVLTVAAWTGAALEAHHFHIPTLQISSVLSGARLLLHLASIALAFLLGALSLQTKRTRVAGT